MAQAPGRWPEPTEPEPDEDEMWDMATDSVDCRATDGCPIEPDGICPHGHPSWLLHLGAI